ASPQGAPDPAAAARTFAAHERWAEALPHFDAALAVATATLQLELRRERALALRGLGNLEGALAELAAVGAANPDGEAGRQAQLDWVQTIGWSGDMQRALAGYREFAAAYPTDPRAPVALGRAIILLEELGDLEGAAQVRLELGRGYPAAEGADRALFLAGMHFYDAGRYDEALGAWDELARRSAGLVAAQATFWKARVAEARGAADAAADLRDTARATAPDSYYAARANELAGSVPQGSVPPGAPIPEADWRTLEDWLAGWAGGEPYRLAERGYPPEVAQDSAVMRAVALAEVGLISESIDEWRAPLRTWRDDPLKLYLLARLAHERGVTYAALVAAERLAAISPAQGPGGVPEALRRLIYPTPYRAIVLERSREYGLDPLALYALLRQESHFNPAALSWVGARGLAQVMPETAQGIAQALGMADFQQDALFRPEVSIRFGAFYLRRQLDNLGGSLPGALAAYNGGAGNARRWAGGEHIADPDLFAERIDFAETRSYVKLVYGAYGAYRGMYQAE
ncbi:MAG TPA: transglycosylase SLT domain-containing protein, partial [Roseiflexaceae bacterium]|nr:transglycosylase SLT domain-containing protein [Roseiflexaceae bacterium]